MSGGTVPPPESFRTEAGDDYARPGNSHSTQEVDDGFDGVSLRLGAPKEFSDHVGDEDGTPLMGVEGEGGSNVDGMQGSGEVGRPKGGDGSAVDGMQCSGEVGRPKGGGWRLEVGMGGSGSEVIATARTRSGSGDQDKLGTLPRVTAKAKPGVILLGRGNSFCLGRSEVMLLHSHRHRKGSHLTPLSDVSEAVPSPGFSHHTDSNQVPEAQAPHRGTSFTQPMQADVWSSPLPVSTNGSPIVSGHEDREVEKLWQQAERLMAAKREAVVSVLDSYGIGEPGCRGEEDEGVQRALEEEDVWQMLQDAHSNHAQLAAFI